MRVRLHIVICVHNFFKFQIGFSVLFVGFHSSAPHRLTLVKSFEQASVVRFDLACSHVTLNVRCILMELTLNHHARFRIISQSQKLLLIQILIGIFVLRLAF